MLIAKVVFTQLVIGLLALLKPLLELSNLLFEVDLFQLEFLSPDHLVLLIALDSFLIECLLSI